MPATAPLRHLKECRRRKCNTGEIPHATLRKSICIFEEKVLAKNSSACPYYPENALSDTRIPTCKSPGEYMRIPHNRRTVNGLLAHIPSQIVYYCRERGYVNETIFMVISHSGENCSLSINYGRVTIMCLICLSGSRSNVRALGAPLKKRLLSVLLSTHGWILLLSASSNG